MKLPDERAALSAKIPLTPDGLQGRIYDEDARDFSAFGGLTGVPLTAAEFVKASLFYPIVFWGDALQAVAVVGVQGSGNLFVDPATGAYDKAAYVPAYLRRDPFALGHDGDILFDPKSSAFGAKGASLFDVDAPSPALAGVRGFLETYERERENTAKMVDLLRNIGLIERRSVALQMAKGASSALPLGDYYAVNEQGVQELSGSALENLNRAGALAPLFAHIASGNQWWPLMVRAATRSIKGPKAAG